ncbi:MAG TPA: YlbF family regulator [Firmicutes bacterium]|nr:YlbF family regulator [Bacillota bacterium]
MSVIAKAYELAKALKESPEYAAYVRAREEIGRHEAARIMLEDLERKREAIGKAALAGEKVDEARLEDLKRTYEIVSFNPYIKELFVAEARLGELVAKVQKIIGEAIGDESHKSPDGLSGEDLPGKESPADEPEDAVEGTAAKGDSRAGDSAPDDR